jgi:hypothetical protein
MAEPSNYPASIRWIAPAALAIALLAAGGAGWALLKPAPAAETSALPGASDDPKAQVCSAFRTVGDGVYRYTHATPSPDLGPALPAAQEAIAANARLAMSGGATYLLQNLPSNAPTDLAGEIRGFAGDLSTIAMKLLAGVPDNTPELRNLLGSADDANKRITGLCK